MKSLFNSYKKSVTPPYGGNDFFVLGATFLVLLIAFVAVISIPSNLEPQNSYTPASHAAGQFLASFNGDPTAPVPFVNHPDYAKFDVQTVQSAPSEWYVNPDQQAQHAPDCAAPPASHIINQYQDTMFNCRNHIMTAINAGGNYAEVIFTPSALLDWTNGPAVLQFQMSTEQMSSRDWIDFMIMPFQDATIWYQVGFNTLPKTAYQFIIRGEWQLLEINNYRDDVMLDGGNFCCPTFNEGITAGTNQAATRQTWKVTMTRNHIKMERLASVTASYLLLIDKELDTPTPFTQGVVSFGQHSYNPTKDNAGVPATWHWDEIFMDPVTPFTIIKADKRYVDTNDAVVRFNSPAPANSYLKFNGVGKVDVSFNNGVSWQTVPSQLVPNSQAVEPIIRPAHQANSFFMPIPQGTQDVKFRFSQDDWYGGPFIARDFNIWSLDISTLPTSGVPTSTPTSGATSTPTPLPTNTPTPTRTPTPSPIPTNTPTPTRTPTPTPTRTPTPIPPTATPTPVKIAGDINGDGQVGLIDFSIMLSDWAPVNSARSDLNGDGAVGIQDFSILLSNWSQ